MVEAFTVVEMTKTLRDAVIYPSLPSWWEVMLLGVSEKYWQMATLAACLASGKSPERGVAVLYPVAD